MANNAQRFYRTTAEPSRRQVVQVLLDATEPLDVHEIRALTTRIRATTVNSCCFALRDARFVGMKQEARQNNKFFILPERRADLEELLNTISANEKN